MTSSGTARISPIGTVRRLDAQDDRSKWIQYYSGYRKYGKSDLFDMEILSSIQQRLTRRSLAKVLSVAVPILFIVMFIVSIALALLGVQAPTYDGSEKSVVDFLMFAATEWFGLSKSLTGNSYMTTAVVTLLVAFLSQAELSWDLWAEAKEYTRQINELRTSTEGARQIYPGSGQLRFSFGRQGLRVAGNNLELSIFWDAIWFTALLRRSELKRRGRTEVHYDVLEPGDDPESATHLLVFLQPPGGPQRPQQEDREKGTSNDEIGANEYLVIPKESFNSYKDATSWLDFTSHIEAFKDQFDASRGAAPTTQGP